MNDSLPGLQYADAGCVNAVTGVFFKLVEHQREDGRVERGREYLREPVKFPGWSQPGVSGLQA